MGDGQIHGRIVSDFAAEWTTAWNSHDMKAFGDLFHDDAAFVNVNGMYAHGRHEIQRSTETVHAGFFRNSTHIPSWRGSCECYALLPVAVACGWSLLLLSAASRVAGRV
jgi:hypothetical protein